MRRESPPNSLFQDSLNPLPKHLSGILFPHWIKQERWCSKREEVYKKWSSCCRTLLCMQFVHPIVTGASGFHGGHFQHSEFKGQWCPPHWGELARPWLSLPTFLFEAQLSMVFTLTEVTLWEGSPRALFRGISLVTKKKPRNQPWPITSRGKIWVLSSLNHLECVTGP